VRRSLARFLWIALALGCGDALEAKGPSAPVDLLAAERQVFSQHGEDGVIEKIFELIEPGPRYVAEFGAYDPILHSNTRHLIQQGWSALLIEGDPARAAKIRATYADNPRVTTKEAWVYPGNIEILFEEAGVPTDLDLLVIDIDSNDYYVWRAIHEFRPKVVMIEMNHQFPPPMLMVVDFHPLNYWDGSSYHGASLQSLANLGKKKGYELLYCMSWGPNAFFVDAKYFERFGIEDNSPEALFKMKPAEPAPFVMPSTGEPFHHDAFTVEKKWILDR
jgi:hypothetical protein